MLAPLLNLTHTMHRTQLRGMHATRYRLIKWTKVILGSISYSHYNMEYKLSLNCFVSSLHKSTKTNQLYSEVNVLLKTLLKIECTISSY